MKLILTRVILLRNTSTRFHFGVYRLQSSDTIVKFMCIVHYFVTEAMLSEV